MKNISLCLLAIAAFFAGETVTNTTASAANKVQTERIILPDEKPEDKNNKDDPKLIPDDALPKLEPKPGDEEGTEAETPTEPTETQEEVQRERSGPPPKIMRDVDALPAPVKRMRELVLKAAKSGDIEKLRALVGLGETATTLSIGGLEGDPIAFLKEASGDEDGFEILAILIEVLEAGYVHVDQGTDNELYVWPYFFAWPLDKLSPENKVELFRILTAGDFEDSANFGSYIFYRVGIKPNGQWSFFVSGD